jgi:DNA-binding transcriptional LysR family regulator
VDLSGVDLNLLVVFEALWLEHSVTGAAVRLHLGQPAVSSALGRLRQLFHDQLFVRVGKEMCPTAKARAIAPELLHALQILRSSLLNHNQFDPRTSTRTFAIATSDYLANLILPTLIQTQAAEFPGIQWQILALEKELWIQDLERGTYDLAIGTFGELPDSIVSFSLIDDSFVGICRHGHPLLTSEMDLERFVSFSHILFTLRRDSHGIVDKLLAGQGYRRRIGLTTPYWFILPNAIIPSDLIAIVPHCLACHFIQHYPIAKFDLPLALPKIVLEVASHRWNESDPALNWLKEKLRDRFSGLEGTDDQQGKEP